MMNKYLLLTSGIENADPISGTVTANMTAYYTGDTVVFTLNTQNGNDKVVYWKYITTGTISIGSTTSGSTQVANEQVALSRTVTYNKSTSGTIKIGFSTSQANLDNNVFFAESAVFQVRANPTSSTTLTGPFSNRQWTVPTGVRQATFTRYAPGGGGGTGVRRGDGQSTTWGNGANGGAGGSQATTLSVSPGDVFTFNGGASGAGAIFNGAAATAGTAITGSRLTSVAAGGPGSNGGATFNGTIGTTGGNGQGGAGGTGQPGVSRYNPSDPATGGDGVVGRIVINW